MEALPILTMWTIERNNSVRGEWSWHVNTIVACCHSAKLCAYAARDFRSQQLPIIYPTTILQPSQNTEKNTKFVSVCKIFLIGIIAQSNEKNFCSENKLQALSYFQEKKADTRRQLLTFSLNTRFLICRKQSDKSLKHKPPYQLYWKVFTVQDFQILPVATFSSFMNFCCLCTSYILVS